MDDPSRDQPHDSLSVALPTGRSITFSNIVVFAREPDDRMLSLQYRTDVPRELHADRVADATALVAIYASFADSQGITRVNAEICSSVAAASMRELPEETFHFSRSADGAWLLENV